MSSDIRCHLCAGTYIVKYVSPSLHMFSEHFINKSWFWMRQWPRPLWNGIGWFNHNKLKIWHSVEILPMKSIFLPFQYTMADKNCNFSWFEGIQKLLLLLLLFHNYGYNFGLFSILFTMFATLCYLIH